MINWKGLTDDEEALCELASGEAWMLVKPGGDSESGAMKCSSGVSFWMTSIFLHPSSSISRAEVRRESESRTFHDASSCVSTSPVAFFFSIEPLEWTDSQDDLTSTVRSCLHNILFERM